MLWCRMDCELGGWGVMPRSYVCIYVCMYRQLHK